MGSGVDGYFLLVEVVAHVAGFYGDDVASEALVIRVVV